MRTQPTLTEVVFLACGVLILFVGFIADFLGIFELGSSTPDAAFPLRLFMTMFGVAFATIGIGYENFPQILEGGEAAKRYIVALLFLADGSLHLYAFTDHLGETIVAAFFAGFSVLQIAAAFVIPYMGRRLDPVWFGTTAFLIVAYIVTRTIAVWPTGSIEAVDPLGVVSKFVEILTALVLLSLIRAGRTAGEASLAPNPER